VLNAFRHHRGGRILSRPVRIRSLTCSTPFGITEVGGATDAEIAERLKMCSTPFGITEVGGGYRRRPWRTSLGAQRLSASQRWAGGHGRPL